MQLAKSTFCVTFLLLNSTACQSQAEGQKAEKTLTEPGQVIFYVGTYTGGESKGIYRLSLDSETGEIGSLGVTSGDINPSFLSISPTGNHLYSVNETEQANGESTGSVSAYRIASETGELEFLNRTGSGGKHPCHIITDREGRYVLVANYSSGNTAVIAVNGDGSLGRLTSLVQHDGSSIDPKRQQGPHAHSVTLDNSNQFAFVADLGLDRIMVYRFDPLAGTLDSGDPPFASVEAGSGPRHFSFSKDERFAFVINELASTIGVFSYDKDAGRLKAIQTVSTLPVGFEGPNYTAEVKIHPSGRFLYGSNRGHNSIAVFIIDERTGQLEPVEIEPSGGEWPRNFEISPDGRYLIAANQNSGNLNVFSVDEKTGRLDSTGYSFDLPNPVCVKFLQR